jgi:hypothetical protein
MAEPSDETLRKRILKATRAKNATIEPGKRRFAALLLCCFGSQFAPDRIILGIRFRLNWVARERLAARGWEIRLHIDLLEGGFAERIFSSLWVSQLDFSRKSSAFQVKNK